MIKMTPKQEGIPTLFVSGLFQIFTLVLLFISLLYRQQGLVLLCLLILVMFNGALLWSRLSLAALTCSLTPAREKVFPGESFVLKAEAANKKFLPVWLELAVTVDRLLLPPAAQTNHPFPPPSPLSPGSSSPPGAKTSSLPEDYSADKFMASFLKKEVLRGEGGLLWQQQAGWQWELTAQQRGVYTTGPLSLASGDLFGFYHQEKIIPQTYEIIVYPRLIPLNTFTSPLRELFGAPGVKSPVVDPVYPVATRDYQEGRPARHIHWKASARHSRLQEKVFEPSAQQKLLLAVDVEGYERKKNEVAFEQTLEVIATLAVQAEQQGRVFGLAGNGVLTGEENLPVFLPPGRGSGQLHYLLEMLARLQMFPRCSMEDSLQKGTGMFRGASCIYFSCDEDGLSGTLQGVFRRLHVPVVFFTAEVPTEGNNKAIHLEALLAEEAVAG